MADLVPFESTRLPAHLRAKELSPLAKALAGGGMSGKRLSVKGGSFRLIVGGKEVSRIKDRHLDVVLVAAAPKIARNYYASTFDEDNVTPPTCWSHDGVAPEPEVKEPQSSACATCPMNVKGSGQGDSRACRFAQRVAVVLANDMEGDVLQLQLAATSLFGKGVKEQRPLQEYARFLAAQQISPDAVVTRLEFDTDVSQPKLFFSPVRWLDEAEYELCQRQGASDDAKQAVTYTVFQQDNAGSSTVPKAKPATAPADEDEAPKPRAKPAPVEEDEAPKPKPKAAKPKPAPEPEEEEAPAPAVRKEPAAPAAAAKRSVSEMLDEWDDEDE
jgi:hypothetical protein